MSCAIYLTNFSSTKKYMKILLDNLNGQTFNYFRDYGCQYAHFYKTQPCSNFFSPAKNSCTKYPKNPTYLSVSNISQRQTDGQTDRKRETDGFILHKHVSFFCSGIILKNAYLNVDAYSKCWMLPEQIFSVQAS
jgi:hypothetical protein